MNVYDSRGIPNAVHHADYWARKGVQEIVLTSPAWPTPVRLLNTHLIARYTSHGQEAGDVYLGKLGFLVSILKTSRASQAIELPKSLS